MIPFMSALTTISFRQVGVDGLTLKMQLSSKQASQVHYSQLTELSSYQLAEKAEKWGGSSPSSSHLSHWCGL